MSTPENEAAAVPEGAQASSPNEADASGAETPVEVDFAAKLTEALEISAKYRDDWLRAKAETDNIRRRAAEDVLKAQKFGVDKMADALLAVKDSMDAALLVENPSVESYKQGVELTARQLTSVFEKFSIREENPVGLPFDPTRHQAITTVESDAAPNTVVTVMQKGYCLHDRVLRPALVAVAKARES